MRGNGDKEGWIRAVSMKMTPPGLKNNTGDVDRLIKEMEKAFPGPEIVPELSLIRRAPAFLREHGYEVDALFYEEETGGSCSIFAPPGEEALCWALRLTWEARPLWSVS
jgi:hypothetical protein